MKKNKIVVGVSIVLIVIIVIGATYAYLASHQDKNKSADINITADTTDTLLFKAGKELSLKATTENFAQGSGNLSGTTDATAILRANSTNNQSETFTYNVYLLIAENTFKYTTDDERVELALTINGPEGIVYYLNDLYYYNKVGGFDITTKKGLIKIDTNREISTTDILEEKWEATVTFRNLDDNQAANGGASFNAKLVLSSEELTLSDYVKLAYEAAPNGNIYYHDENLENGAEDFSYRYTGSNEMVNNYVCLGSDCTDQENLYRIIGTFDVNGEYQTKLIKATIASSDLLGTGGDYIPDEDVYVWNATTSVNYESIDGVIWKNTLLNKTNLNSTDNDGNPIEDGFLYNIGTTWANMIAEHDWIVAGNTLQSLRFNTVKGVYNSELINYDNTQNIEPIYSAKVGLMYVSDYLYAASNEHWSKSNNAVPGYTDANGNSGEEYDYRSAYKDNWLFYPDTKNEWTITTPTFEGWKRVFVIFKSGTHTGVAGAVIGGGYNVRPTFYLNSDVKIYGGSGTSDDPYIILDNPVITNVDAHLGDGFLEVISIDAINASKYYAKLRDDSVTDAIEITSFPFILDDYCSLIVGQEDVIVDFYVIDENGKSSDIYAFGPFDMGLAACRSKLE